MHNVTFSVDLFSTVVPLLKNGHLLCRVSFCEKRGRAKEGENVFLLPINPKIKDYNFFKQEVNMKVRSGIFLHPANRNKAWNIIVAWHNGRTLQFICVCESLCLMLGSEPTISALLQAVYEQNQTECRDNLVLFRKVFILKEETPPPLKKNGSIPFNPFSRYLR